MPCLDGGPPFDYPGELRKVEAMLCAVLRTIDTPPASVNELLKYIDYDEAGFSRSDLIAWWKEHKRHDEERRAREAELREHKERRKSALAKLTPEDMQALGIYLSSPD
jgi:hypothetical protein